MTQLKEKLTGAENVNWNLNDMYPGIDSAEIKADLAKLDTEIDAFANQYRGKVTELSAEELLKAVEKYEEIVTSMARLGTYSVLSWVTDTLDTDMGRFMTTIQQQNNAMSQRMLFFELEWKNAPEEFAKLAETPALSKYQHYLETSRLEAPYTLSEPEEKIIAELSMTSSAGWNRYFSEVMSNARYELDGEKLNQSEVLKHIQGADRDLRKRAADAVTKGLHETSHTTTFIFNMLANYKQSTDKVRAFETWISSRNLSNEVDDATVNTLVESVTSRYDIVHRYYNLAKRLLGHDELYDYDRYAPILDETVHYSWDDARDIVLDAYGKFDPRMAEIAGYFFEKQWIDAAIAPNKRGGAFSQGGVPDVHPYILMNYTGTDDSVMTLAHELGHGVHQYLSASQGYLQSSTPLTTAEMASTFGEMLVFESLMDRTEDPRLRLSMRLKKISSTFATVFRQIAMNRFENAYHTSVRREGQLSTQQLSEIWMSTQRPMFGDSLTLRDEYSIWWSYVPHFLGVPGYVYAYSFGELLVWTLYAKYQNEGGDFAKRYLDALSKGGSMWPHKLLAPMGVDLQDPNFWNEGLKLIEDMVIQAEEEAAVLDYNIK